MKLGAFLDQSHLSQNKLAPMVGTSQKTISELVNKTGKTSLAVSVRIEQVTHGLVTADEIPMHEEDQEALRYLRPNGAPSRKRHST